MFCAASSWKARPSTPPVSIEDSLVLAHSRWSSSADIRRRIVTPFCAVALLARAASSPRRLRHSCHYLRCPCHRRHRRPPRRLRRPHRQSRRPPHRPPSRSCYRLHPPCHPRRRSRHPPRFDLTRPPCRRRPGPPRRPRRPRPFAPRTPPGRSGPAGAALRPTRRQPGRAKRRARNPKIERPFAWRPHPCAGAARSSRPSERGPGSGGPGAPDRGVAPEPVGPSFARPARALPRPRGARGAGPSLAACGPREGLVASLRSLAARGPREGLAASFARDILPRSRAARGRRFGL